MSFTADAVIIGAGVIGSSIAFELAKSGRSVVVVDKAGGSGLGSTSASSAVVRFNYSTWDGVAASWESKHCWDEWPDHIQTPDVPQFARFLRTGLVMLDVPVAPKAKVLSLFDVVGVPYETWDATTLAARVPGLDTGKHWPPKSVDDDAFWDEPTEHLGAIFTPDAGFVDDPQLAAQNLAAAALARGARYRFNRAVVQVLRRDGRVTGVVLSDGTTVQSPVVVNVAGPWSAAVNSLAGVGGDFTISVRPMRQEVHVVQAPPGFNRGELLGPAIADLDLGTYMRPAHGDQMLIGGTEPKCDPLQWLDDPDQANPRVTAKLFESQVLRAARRFPQMGVPRTPNGIAGVYDVSDDWTPIYDRTDLEGFFVAIGTSGNQFKNAPVVGQLMSGLIGAVESGQDHDADPYVFTGNHTGLKINVGAFSRRRPPSESTGTVMG